MRTLYAHSYQSFIWNRAASERIRRYGRTVVPGDIVFVPKHSVQSSSTPSLSTTNKALNEEEEEEAVTDNKTATNVETDEQHIQEDEVIDKEVEEYTPIIVQSEEEASKYTLRDVVLPLPGHSVIFPTNTVGEFYHMLMKVDGIDTTTFMHKNRDFRLPGSYRRLIEIPQNMKW